LKQLRVLSGSTSVNSLSVRERACLVFELSRGFSTVWVNFGAPGGATIAFFRGCDTGAFTGL
jgi:hypothetical protein